MTSLPASFPIGSASSSYSVRDAIASYRRAQYFATSNVPPASDLVETQDEESGVIDYVDEADDPTYAEDFDDQRTPVPQDGMIDQFDWDDMLPESSAQVDNIVSQTQRDLRPIRPQLPSSRPSGENTPLLRKAVSFSDVAHPRRLPSFDKKDAGDEITLVPEQNYHSIGLSTQAPLIRRNSSSSTKISRHNYGGKSTYGQTLFNSIAILLGIGMLSEPLAFAYAGWIGGTILIVFYGFITCYTAKILAHIILDDPRLRSYADIGRKAFGPKSTPLTSALFCLELFALSVVLVTLYADSLHSVAPSYSANTYKLWGLVVLIPTVFLPLSLLSYASMIGIISTLSIIAVIFIDGFSKKESPGSLWSPADTQFGVGNWGKLGVAFGLFMAGFSGHAVIPSLARDMVDPQQFDHMINWAFVIATFIYAVIGYAGYLMFGRYVSDEVSTDLLSTPGYNPYLNKAALWMLVISPLSKFALCTRPLNITLEIMLGLETHAPPASPEDISAKTTTLSTPKNICEDPHHNLKRLLTVVERVVFTFLSVGASILVPEFSSVMAFLGSFSAFMLCVIGPVSAKSALAGRWGIWDVLLLVVAVVMAVWGTVAAFWST